MVKSGTILKTLGRPASRERCRCALCVKSFVTLYWAEVATEFEPRTGQRAGWASTRNPHYDGSRSYWAQPVLYCYQWHNKAPAGSLLVLAPFFASAYCPPEIVSAIARDEKRGSYLATARRAGMTPDDATEPGSRVIFDKNGDSHIRRDVYYTPDYTLSTISYDPRLNYRSSIILAQAMGATFASDQHDRIVALGRGYYGSRAISGITGPGVSVIAREPKAEYGRGRFKSDGTRVFISNGKLWDHRVEDASGWFFTRAGDAYAAIRVAAGGCHISTIRFAEEEKAKELEDPHGHYLDFNDMWAPVVIQMGRATDYKSFGDFCAAVKANRFEYQDGKLTYTSAAKDTYEYWSNSKTLPRINGTTVKLNPAKTFDSPFLSMEHGSSKAVITYPGRKDFVVDFK